RDVVKRIVWLPLIKEPEPLLSKRKERSSIAWQCLQRWYGKGGMMLQLFDLLSKVRNSWLFEEGAQSYFSLEGVADARHNLSGQQGMASQLKEILLDADLSEA